MAGFGAFEGTSGVLDRLAPRLRRFARILLAGRGRPTAPDEIVQAALARLRLPHPASDSAIRVAAYGAVVQAHRARQMTFSHASEPGRASGRLEIAERVERLPLDQREVLLLVVLEQFTYDEAATALGLPQSSIVARLVRARGSLDATREESQMRHTHLRLVK